MLAKVFSCAVTGVEGLPIEVEVDIGQGLPFFSTVGLAEGAVREAKDRVRSAVKNSGYHFPARKITVNLAPASVKKIGTGYDLPIALGILAASACIDLEKLQGVAVSGELSLDGSVRPVSGVLSMALAAKKEKLSHFLVPSANAKEAAVVEGITVIGIERLEQAVQFLRGELSIAPTTVDLEELFRQGAAYGVDFADVKGQEHVKRAFEVAAAGGHNLLLTGIPGTGKTMMARRLPTILPDLTIDEAIETSKVFSSAGLLAAHQPLLLTRPFRSPHHTVSDAGLIGGGQNPRPGEVSMAHNGVLFLDELPEFKKSVLEVLRQPLEDGEVTISRALTSLHFPANFMMVAASNPCPCGFLGDGRRQCSCTPVQVQRYRSRLSGPLLDRIDIHIEVPAVPVEDLLHHPAGEPSASIKSRVNKARRMQVERFSGIKGLYCNASMNAAQINEFCPVDTQTEKLLTQSIQQLGLSARAYHRILKIARTIADIDNCPDISLAHAAEAVQYRRTQTEI